MIKIKNRAIRILIIINLILLACILLGKIQLLHKLAATLGKGFLIPLFISVLLYYIIRPINNHFIEKGMGRGKASMLSLVICTFILSGILSYFAKYAMEQFRQLTNQLIQLLGDGREIDGFVAWLNQYINVDEIYTLAAGMVKNYIHQIGLNFKRFVGYFMNTFSTVFLILVIVFYMLKDGNVFKEKVLYFIPEKYKPVSDTILSDSDVILSHYVTGQAKVALALAIMIFTGYKIIGMPNAMLLSSITFILAFIPFVGFFISMIIPSVISLGMGIYMSLKLGAVFIIVQTLKGRVVVPAVMAKSMKIHPLTDIFLVIGAIAVGGPFAAFAIVPIYAIVKNALRILKFKEKLS